MSEDRKNPKGHQPIRTCVGCRQKKPNGQLLRLGLFEGLLGRLFAVKDFAGKLPGRGAWVCADQNDCLEKARRKGNLNRALRVADLDISRLFQDEENER